MGLLGLKRKRSPEEQKEYEKKVFETPGDGGSHGRYHDGDTAVLYRFREPAFPGQH